MKRLCIALCTAVGLCAALPASAQFQRPEDAIKYRKSAMFLMNTHMGRLGAMVNGRAPFDAKLAADSADVVNSLARLPWPAFMVGTDKGDTRATPEIWSEADKFKAGATKLQDDAAKLGAAAKTGDLAQLRTAFGTAAQTCKACHDHYRQD